MDLNQVKSLFTATDFERGMEYYRKGRVTDMQCTKAGPETNVSCTVRGSKRYTVRFTEMAEGRLRISCTCPRYADVGRCKHLAAAMIAYIGEPPHESVPGSDSCARWMLQRYLQITQESIEPSQQPVRSDVRCCAPDMGPNILRFPFVSGMTGCIACRISGSFWTM